MLTLLRRMGAEAFGAFCLVAVGGFAIVGLPAQAAPIGVPIVFGVVVGLLVYTLARTSGAHLNPAITLALCATGRHPLHLAPAYIVSQLLGGTAGAMLVYAISDNPLALLTQPATHIHSGQAIAIEALATGILAFVIAAASDAKRADGSVPATPIGMAILLGALFAGPFTGGSMNPARSIGPALVALDLSLLWVYLVGPIVGALAGALLHDLMASRKKPAGASTKVPSELTPIQGSHEANLLREHP